MLVETEPMADERLRTLIDDELKAFNVKQGDSTKKVEEINTEVIKQHSNSLAYRAEGKYRSFFSAFIHSIQYIFSCKSHASH
jgi:hypothetical protein